LVAHQEVVKTAATLIRIATRCSRQPRARWRIL